MIEQTQPPVAGIKPTNMAGYEMERARMWAFGAVNRMPLSSDYMGLDYSTCSRRMVAMCEAGARTGRTLMASYHLEVLRVAMIQRAAFEQIAMNENDGLNEC